MSGTEGTGGDGPTIDRLISHNLHAKHTWIVPLPAGVQVGEDGIDAAATGAALDLFGEDARIARALGGEPIACCDLRAFGREAHEVGALMVCDNTLATSFGCAAVRLGADIAFEWLGHALGKAGRGLLAVSVSKTYLSSHPASYTRLDSLAKDVDCSALTAPYVAWDDERKRQNDAALAIAEYLVCHPKVAHVWYPGLLRDQRDSSRTDPANAQAPNILLGGFGPVVDFELAPDALRGATPHLGRKSPLRALNERLVRLTCTQGDVVAQAQAVEQALAAI